MMDSIRSSRGCEEANKHYKQHSDFCLPTKIKAKRTDEEEDSSFDRRRGSQSGV